MTSLGMRQTMEIGIKQKISYSNTAGELELLSLHRIKNRISSMGIYQDTRKVLIANLIQENKKYRTEEKHNRYCILPNHMVSSVDLTSKFLIGQTDIALETLDKPIKEKLKPLMYGKVEEQGNIMKNWFHDNYEHLIYDTNGKIPFPIIKKLRSSFGIWALKGTNPFQEPMENIIEKTMSDLGYDTSIHNNAQKNWDLLKKPL